jgi:sugar phosphate isomerase/epimerase
MSTSTSAAGSRVERAVAASSPADVESVELTAAALDSTAPEYLRELKAELAAAGYQPATLRAEASFDEAGSLAAQREADRLRELVRAASFVGAGRLAVDVDRVADEAAAEPALAALAERAERDGVTLTLDGPVSV